MLMIQRTPRMIDIFPDWLTGSGICTELAKLDVPWNDDIDGTTLDIEYFGNISGYKSPSPLITKLLQQDATTTLTDARREQIASTIFKINIDRWTKLYNTLSVEYNPINNYDMTETETVTGSNSDTRLNTGTTETEHTGTQGTSETNTVTGSGSTDNTIFGFNSSTASDDSGSETSSTNTGTGSSTRTDNLKDTRTDDLSETNSGSHSESRSLTRSGNIGVTTTQQMLESERALNMWNFFYKILFKDIDKVMTIATYSNAPSIEIGISGGGGGGGDTDAIMDKLNELENKIDTNTASINNKIDTNTASINSSISSKIDGAVTNINNNVDLKTASISLDINQLRVSTFNAIDGVSNRSY